MGSLEGQSRAQRQTKFAGKSYSKIVLFVQYWDESDFCMKTERALKFMLKSVFCMFS